MTDVTNPYGGTFPSCATCPYVHWTDGGSVTTCIQDAICGTTITSDARGAWGVNYLQGMASATNWSLSHSQDLPALRPGFVATQWTNIQIEYDFEVEQLSKDGIIWAAQDADNNASPEAGYLFRIRGSSPFNSSQDNHPSAEASTVDPSLYSRNCSAWDRSDARSPARTPTS